jgi:prevent-host-death family protein
MEDKQVRSDEARRNLRDLLDEVEHHDVHVTILRYDKPAGVIVSVEWYEQATQAIKDSTARAGGAK